MAAANTAMDTMMERFGFRVDAKEVLDPGMELQAGPHV